MEQWDVYKETENKKGPRCHDGTWACIHAEEP